MHSHEQICSHVLLPTISAEYDNEPKLNLQVCLSNGNFWSSCPLCTKNGLNPFVIMLYKLSIEMLVQKHRKTIWWGSHTITHISVSVMGKRYRIDPSADTCTVALPARVAGYWMRGPKMQARKKMARSGKGSQRKTQWRTSSRVTWHFSYQCRRERGSEDRKTM